MNRRHLAICSIALLVAVAATGYVYGSLPDIVPRHWNMRGEVDGWWPRWMVWLTGPGLMALMPLLRWASPRISPRRHGMDDAAPMFDYMTTVLVSVVGCMHVTTLIAMLDVSFDIGRTVLALLFVCLILVGNPLGKVRRNFFVGIRTPWALANEKVWYGTHRLGGKVLVGTGVAGLLMLAAGVPTAALGALPIAGALVPAVYSLVLYKRLEREGQL